MKEILRERIVMELILNQLCESYNVDLRKKGKPDDLVAARGAFAIYCKQHFLEKAATNIFIGKILNRNHSTITNYLKYKNINFGGSNFGKYYKIWHNRIVKIHAGIRLVSKR